MQKINLADLFGEQNRIKTLGGHLSKVESKDSTEQLSSFIFWLFSEQLKFVQLIGVEPVVNTINLINLETLQKEHSWLVNKTRDFVVGFFKNDEGFKYLVYGKKANNSFELEIYQFRDDVINIINNMKVKLKGNKLFSSSGSNIFFTQASTSKYKTICETDFTNLSFEEHHTTLIEIFNLVSAETV